MLVGSPIFCDNLSSGLLIVKEIDLQIDLEQYEDFLKSVKVISRSHVAAGASRDIRGKRKLEFCSIGGPGERTPK